MKDMQRAAGDLWGRLKGAADRRRDGCQSILEVQEEPRGRRPGGRTAKLLFVVLLAVLQVSASTASV